MSEESRFDASWLDEQSHVEASPSEDLTSEALTKPGPLAEAHAEVFFSVDQFRRSLLRRVAIPEDLVEQALKVTHDKLFAKRIKYFSRKGIVTDERIVEDHAIQLQAADQIYSLASLYARERDAIQTNNGVAVEFDTVRGVLRIVVGDPKPNGSLSSHHLPDSVGLIPKPALNEIRAPEVATQPNPDDVERFNWKVLTDEEVE